MRPDQPTEQVGLSPDLMTEAANRFGTPCYLYDLPRITEQVSRLRSAFPGADVRYAVKANANLAVLRHMAGLGLGAEALTLGELERSLLAGISPHRILLGGPGITPQLALRALRVGVELVSLDSEGAYEVFEGLVGEQVDDGPRYLVRLNPGFDPHTHEHLATAAEGSKFGLPHGQAVSLAERVAGAGRLAGFHVHAGSMLEDPEVARLVVRSLEPLYDRFPELALVDLGGGFAVPEPPLAAFAAEYLDFAERYGLAPIVEPGRLLVADAGVLLTRVLHVKTGSRRHVIADAGMADLLRPALYGARHPVSVVGREGQPELDPRNGEPRAAEPPATWAETDVDGPLCENADRLAQGVELGEVRPGDLLAVGRAGAYGMAMASNYVSSLRPAEVVWDGAELRLARRRETPEDLWRLEADMANSLVTGEETEPSTGPS